MTTSFMLLVPLLGIFLWLLPYILMQDKISHETTGKSIPKITSEELNLELWHPSPLECIYSCDQTQRGSCVAQLLTKETWFQHCVYSWNIPCMNHWDRVSTAGKCLERRIEGYSSINVTGTVEELVMPLYIVSVLWNNQKGDLWQWVCKSWLQYILFF